MMKKVSIITVCYNAESQIKDTIESVINQDYDNYDYIIIDGKSSDNTSNIINNYAESIDVLVSEIDNGIFDAMNKGLNLINSEWVLFMNAGDVFYNENVLSRVFKTNEFSSEIGFVFGDMVYFSENMLVKAPCLPFYQSKQYVKEMGFSHQSVFVRSKLAQRFKFDTKLKLTADYDMILKIYSNNFLGKYIDVIVSIMDMHGVSANNRLLQIYETGIIYKLENSNKFKLYYFMKKFIFKVKPFLGLIN